MNAASFNVTQQQALMYALLLFGTLILLWLSWSQLTRDDVLPVQEVRLAGEFAHVQQAELAQKVLPNINGNFFTLNVEQIHQQVASLPWVHRVWVDRIWPNIVRVRIEEQQPVARWNDRGLINADAQVFVEAASDENLLQLYGPEPEKQRLLSKLPVFSELLHGVGLNLQRLKVDERLAWKMTLDNGAKVIIGRQEVEQRVQRFVKVYQAYLRERADELQQVDLRYANGLAVQWKTAQKV